MADGIDQIAVRLNRLIKDSNTDWPTRLQASGAVDGQNAERTLSNTSLLLESLANFYGDSNSEFFPTLITATIRERLSNAETAFNSLTADSAPVTADLAPNLLKNLEELYAYCLQYGLITYGFTGKLAQEQIEVIRRIRQQIETAAKRFLILIDDQKSELHYKLEAFARPVADAESALKSTVTERINALQPSIDGLAALLASGQSDSTNIGNILKAAAESAAAIAKVRADLETAYSQATTELAARKTTADTELSNIQSLVLQVQKLESDAKAMHQSVTDSRSKLSDQLTQITAFYGEIETHRGQMMEARKESQSHLTELRESTQKSITGLRERTEGVVKTNESLIEQINDHLRKAIGASLFTAFNTRRRHISIAGWVWGGLLLSSVGCVIWFAYWFVGHLAEIAKSDVHPALVYARLAIAAPLTFLIYFSSKQYASERRAEEEYAFKSAISVSLDSYRDLIARMKKEGHDTAFVERLVLEIFDNPAKRLYTEPPTTAKKDGLDVLNLVKEALDKVPKAD